MRCLRPVVRIISLGMPLLAISACGGGGNPPNDNTAPANEPPTVEIQTAETALELTSVSLTAIAEDADADNLSYEWTQTSGTPVELTAADTAHASFKAPKVSGTETLAFSVAVDDGSNAPVIAQAQILVVEGEFVAFLASKNQANAIEMYRIHGSDEAAANLADPVPQLEGGPFVDGYSPTKMISPDGRRVMWMNDTAGDGNYILTIASIFGERNVRTVSSFDMLDIAWSPDGSMIAFVAYVENEGRALFVMPADTADGSDARKISGPILYSDGDPGNGALDGVVWDFAWSPDSSMILFRGKITDGQNRLFVVSAESTDGSDRRPIGGTLPPGGHALYYTWSPDSSVIAYTGDVDGGGRELVVVPAGSADGDDREIIFSSADVTLVNTGSVNWPTFSPDGKLIAIAGRPTADPTKFELFVMNPDGSDRRRVSGDSAVAAALHGYAWAPDGSAVVMLGDLETDGIEALFVVSATSADGNDRMRISGADVDSVEEFAWAPDSSRIAFVGHLEDDARQPVFSVAADGSNRHEISGAGIDFDDDTIADTTFHTIRWSSSGDHIYFLADVQGQFEYELFKVPADSADGSDRVSVSGPMASGGGHVSEYDVHGPVNEQ